MALQFNLYQRSSCLKLGGWRLECHPIHQSEPDVALQLIDGLYRLEWKEAELCAQTLLRFPCLFPLERLLAETCPPQSCLPGEEQLP